MFVENMPHENDYEYMYLYIFSGLLNVDVCALQVPQLNTRYFS
jgi:hypothetical protein